MDKFVLEAGNAFSMSHVAPVMLTAKSCFANPFAKRLRAEKKNTMRGLRADYARRRNK